jgi:ATP-dependent helicase HrpB
VAAALDAKGARIRLGAALDPAQLPETLRRRCRTTREAGFDAASGAVLTRERLRLGTLILADRTLKAEPEEVQRALAEALASRLDQLDWTEAVRNFQGRCLQMRQLDPEFPEGSREALAVSTEAWLAPHLAGCTTLREAKALDLLKVLRLRLSHRQRAALDAALPELLNLPGGTARIDYTGPHPVVAAPAKWFYGLDESPKLAAGRIALQLALLSPARRPIAITGDLPGFWRNGWRDARQDMRSRYPKHDWPEQPWQRRIEAGA